MCMDFFIYSRVKMSYLPSQPEIVLRITSEAFDPMRQALFATFFHFTGDEFV